MKIEKSDIIIEQIYKIYNRYVLEFLTNENINNLIFNLKSEILISAIENNEIDNFIINLNNININEGINLLYDENYLMIILQKKYCDDINITIRLN